MAEKETEKPAPKKSVRERRNISRRIFLDPSTPSNLSVFRVVLIVLLMLAVKDFVGALLSSLTYLFFLIVLSIFFAYLIDPLVKLIRRPFKVRNLEKLMPRALAIVIAYVFVFTVLGVAIANLAPRVAQQAADFAQSLPSYAASFQERIAELNNRYENLQIPADVQTRINEKFNQIIEGFANFITTVIVGVVLINAVSYAPWLVLVPILSFFFLKDVNLFRALFLRCFPSGRWRARVESVLEDVNKTLAAYTRAQLISCFIIGTVCTAAFYLMGLKYALLLGIMAGIFEFVPLIGPLTIGLIATSVAAFSEYPWEALYVAVFLIILRVVHDYVTYPRIVRESIHLHPLAIILSVLAGEQIAGIPGVFLSIPIVALLTVIYRHVLEHSGSKGFFAGWLEPEKTGKEA